jgi:O-antigen ligase
MIMGFLFSTFSPFLLYFLLQEKGKRLLLSFFANVLLWGAVAINGSRGSWVAIAVGLGISLILLIRFQPRKFSGLFVGIVFVGSFLALSLIAIPRVSEAVLSRFYTFQTLETDKSYLIRQLMNQKALRLFKESPIIGVGTARFRIESIPLEIPQVLSYAPQAHFDRKSAHNSFLGFLAENGLLASIPLALLLSILSMQGIRAQNYFIHQNNYWALAVFTSFLQMSIHMWGINALANTVCWFVYGMVVAMIVMRKNFLEAS